jgi:hypothetical protein
MNKAALKKNLYARVQLRPAAREFDGNVELPKRDDEWIIQAIEESRIRLDNTYTRHVAMLGYDHVHHFVSDPARAASGITFGFLVLTVQINLSGDRLWIEPTLRPGEPV